METFKVRGFNLEVSHHGVTLSDPHKGGVFTFSSGEGESIREFLGILWKLSGLPTVPKTIHSPSGMLIANYKDNLFELKRSDGDRFKPGVFFKIGECDWVIEAVDAGVAKFRDVYSLTPQPRGAGQYTYTGPNDSTDIFEGR